MTRQEAVETVVDMARESDIERGGETNAEDILLALGVSKEEIAEFWPSWIER